MLFFLILKLFFSLFFHFYTIFFFLYYFYYGDDSDGTEAVYVISMGHPGQKGSISGRLATRIVR